MSVRFWSVFAFAVVLAAGGPAAAQPAVVYDSITGVTAFSAPSATRTFVGQGLNFGTASGTGPIGVTSMEIGLASLAAVNYNDTRVQVQLWNDYDINAAGTTLAFSNPSGGVQQFTTGTFAAAANTIYTFTLTFATPVVIDNVTEAGISVNWQGDTGAGFANTDNLTSGLRGANSPVPTVGTNPDGEGYFRNASGLTTFNFQGGDFRTIGANSGMLLRINAVPVPEPASLLLVASVALGGVAGLRRWSHRARR